MNQYHGITGTGSHQTLSLFTLRSIYMLSEDKITFRKQIMIGLLDSGSVRVGLIIYLRSSLPLTAGTCHC